MSTQMDTLEQYWTEVVQDHLAIYTQKSDKVAYDGYWGPVYIEKGKFKGTYAYRDDDHTEKSGYVYFENGDYEVIQNRFCKIMVTESGQEA